MAVETTQAKTAADRQAWDDWRVRLEGPPAYGSWRGMHERCGNPVNADYSNYGGRGITVCERWFSYASFIADMGPPPSPQHSLDRFPNNDGPYEPGNCRWATAKEQYDNRQRAEGAF